MGGMIQMAHMAIKHFSSLILSFPDWTSWVQELTFIYGRWVYFQFPCPPLYRHSWFSYESLHQAIFAFVLPTYFV